MRSLRAVLFTLFGGYFVKKKQHHWNYSNKRSSVRPKPAFWIQQKKIIVNHAVQTINAKTLSLQCKHIAIYITLSVSLSTYLPLSYQITRAVSGRCKATQSQQDGTTQSGRSSFSPPPLAKPPSHHCKAALPHSRSSGQDTHPYPFLLRQIATASRSPLPDTPLMCYLIIKTRNVDPLFSQ